MIRFSAYFIPACFIVFILYWMWSARSAKTAAESRGFQWGITPAILVIFGTILALRFFGVHLSLRGALWHRTIVGSSIADVVVVGGLVLTLWARVVLGTNWSRGVEFKQNHELIERGPYAVLRHPIYTGILTMFAGAICFYASATSIILFIAIGLLFWFKAKSEEKLMMEHFPNEYAAYKTRTWRLVPYVV